MSDESQLRAQVVALLRGGNAHMPFSEAVADFPDAMINVRPRNVPYSFWHLIEHLRLTQLDIVEYVTNQDYREKEWPSDYWPASEAEATREQWDETISSFNRDLDQLIALARDPATDLFATVPSNDQHTLLREMLIVADHNAYHVGELAILRQVEGAWGPGHRSQ